MGKKILKNMDWGILVCIVILLAIGLVALFSATQGTEYEENVLQFVKEKQIQDLIVINNITIIGSSDVANTISGLLH